MNYEKELLEWVNENEKSCKLWYENPTKPARVAATITFSIGVRDGILKAIYDETFGCCGSYTEFIKREIEKVQLKQDLKEYIVSDRRELIALLKLSLYIYDCFLNDKDIDTRLLSNCIIRAVMQMEREALSTSEILN